MITYFSTPTTIKFLNNICYVQNKTYILTIRMNEILLAKNIIKVEKSGIKLVK